jgi:hypothetical protein
VDGTELKFSDDLGMIHPVATFPSEVTFLWAGHAEGPQALSFSYLRHTWSSEWVALSLDR